jgi:hypothetical protein
MINSATDAIADPHCGQIAADAILGSGMSDFIENLALRQSAVGWHIFMCGSLPNLSACAYSQCNPPSATCLRIYHDLTRWQYSAEGSACMDTLEDVLLWANNVTSQVRCKASRVSSPQVLNRQFCTGRCGAGFSYYMARMENAGCNLWAAYIVNKVRKEAPTSFLRLLRSNFRPAATRFCLAVLSPTAAYSLGRCA